MMNKGKNNSEKSYELWEVTEKCGRHQMIQYSCVCFATLLLSMTNINYVFVAGDVNYRCRVPECEGPYTSYKTEWWPNRTIDRCSRPLVNSNLTGDTCTASSFTGLVEECSEWIYESNDTIVSGLNLACEPFKISMVGTIHNIGMLISTLVAGWVCDKFGRKPALIFFCVAIIVGNLKSIAPSYYPYAALELVEATLSGGTYTAATVLIIEISGKKYRLLSGVLLAYAVYVAETIYVGIAMAVPYWKNLIHILYTPPIICLSFIFLLKESPRWQFINGQKDKALETIVQEAKTNKLKLIQQDPAEIEEKLKENLNIADVEESESYTTIFTSKQILLRVLVTTVARFTTSFVYYGLMINSVFLPGNKYTNFLLSTLMSFPGELIAFYMMGKIGRRLPLAIGFIFCGIVCAGSGYVPECFQLRAHTTLSDALIEKKIIAKRLLYESKLIPYWKNLIHILYTPPIICLSFIFLLKESPRWQFINGQKDKALETIVQEAKTNKLKLIQQDPAEIEEKLKENLNIADVEESESYTTIFTSKQILLRVLVTTVARFTTSFVYYGLMINSVFLPGNKYTNFLLSTLMSFPGELIAFYMMGKIGRRLPLAIGFIFCGIVCAGSGYVPESATWLKITLFLLGKMVISACFTGVLTYSMELFPTNARGTLLGITALAAEAGSMLAPLSPLLNAISVTLPTLFFGTSAVVTGLLLGLTPETRDLPLMDTVEQVEASMKDMKAKEQLVNKNADV